MAWILLERKKRLKKGQEMSKKELLRLSRRDREEKGEEKISKGVKESIGATLCSLSSSPPPTKKEKEKIGGRVTGENGFIDQWKKQQ